MLRALRPLLLVAVASLLVAPMLPGQSDRPATGRWRCDTNTGPVTIYATPFMEWTGLAQELQNAFQQHLLARYGYTGRVSCSMASPGGPTLAQLDADMQRQYGQFRAAGKKVVELPWTITDAGITLAYGCNGVAQVRRAGVPDSTYLLQSRIFRIRVGSMPELSLAWIDHLKSLHPGWYFQSPGCVLLPADPAAHQGVMDSYVTMYQRFKPAVTRLAWQFQPGAASVPQAPAPAPAAAPALAPASAPPPAPAPAPTSTYHPTSPGNPMCAILPSDPAQRAAYLKSFNLLTQPATQTVVKTAWKP